MGVLYCYNQKEMKIVKKENQDIKEAIRNNKLKFWQIAAALGINDGNFSRLLRKELTKEKKQQILEIIKMLKEEN